MSEADLCSVIGCANRRAVHLYHRKRGITHYVVCYPHLKEIKLAYLKEDVENKFTA